MSQTSCGRCGAALPEGARFCPSCGFPVGAPAAEERKVVSVVFVDLVGSTRLSALIDAERYRDVLAAYYQAVAEELESLRGRSVNVAGDAVVGVFGLPQVHDDDALRAIRAGLSIAARVEKVGGALALPVSLRCRVAVTTGPVAVGVEAAERGLLSGAVVNAAARLQQATEPGTVIVGEVTRLLTQDAVEYGERKEVRAKGFDEALFGFPVVALAPRSSRRTIPFVDRRRELRLLADTFERAVESRRGHMITLLGEPGIGKSRLADEFLAGLPDGTKVLTGRASPFEEDVTFAPLAQILLQEIDERPDAPPDRLQARLEEVVLACCPSEETGPMIVRLGYALGLGDESREERRYRAAEVRSGLAPFLRGLSQHGPVVLVFEDLHLAEEPLLELIEQLGRDPKGMRLLVLCVARSELLDRRPGWGGGVSDSLNLHLEPMSLEDATELALQASEGLDASTAELIARHAGGNPFFIVETTGMLLYGGVGLSPDAESLPGRLLPPTVQAVIAERIDHLSPDVRDLLRKASVFARSTFDLSELALIAEPSEQVLVTLEDEELLERDQEGVWRFRHGLVRDVAYESLPKRERTRLHLLVAEALSGDAESAARHPRSIAYHLEQAARAALDLDPKDRSLAERAFRSLSHAGGLALEASDARAAADLCERALAMAGARRAWGLPEAMALSNLGEARYWLGEFEGAAGPLTRALEIGADDPGIRAHASRFLGDIELSIRGNPDRASELLDQALAAARELGDPWTLARTLLVAGWVPYWRDDLAAARAMFEEALAVTQANPQGDPWAEARALGTLATVIEEDGDEEECLALHSRALAIGEANGDPFSIGVAREGVGNALRRMWRLDEALPHVDGAVGAFRELGARWELASALTSRGILHRVAGRTPEAITDLREAYRICREVKERSIVTWTASALAQALVGAGDAKAARQVLREAASVANPEGPAPMRWLEEAEVWVLLAEGDREGAMERAGEFLRVARDEGRAKDAAVWVWRIGRALGPEEAGGEEELAAARKLLESVHLLQVLREPSLAGG
ncbi:MAG: tetratricopeptide repeat protein [Actinomycetota bacterium]